MAIYHLHVDIVSRKTGRSSVASSAYRAGEKLHNERDGMTHDFTRKLGIVHSEIMLPDNAPDTFQDRGTLWNAVEKSEKRCDAQTARDIDIALPVEFDLKEQVEIMREYIRENFVLHGMCADFAIHNKGDGNPHAHILLTTREVTNKGFKGKNRDWNKTEILEQWREKWANICNDKLKEKGLNQRIDHRTLEAQGINREPSIHIGVVAKSMERAGRNSDRIREYREITERNEAPSPEATAEYMHELKQGYVIVDKEISAIKQETADIQREMQSLRFKAEIIIERAEEIHTKEEWLAELKAEQQKGGFRTSKKAIDEEIRHVERSIEQSTNYFKKIYHIPPEEATAKAMRLEYEAKDMERIQERLQDRINPLEADKEVFALEYQRQKLLAEISPDKQDIQNELARLDKEVRTQGQSIQDRISRTQSERTLDIVTERNFQEILKDVSPEQAKKLIEWGIKEHVHKRVLERWIR